MLFRSSSATPSATIAQLRMPKPNSTMKVAKVPVTAPTSFRAGATGRPAALTTVYLLAS